MSKAAAFAEDAKQAGWDVSDQKTKGTTETVIIRNETYGAVMVMVWEGGRYIYAKSELTVGGHRRTVRNASEGRRFLAGVEAPKTTIPKRRPKRHAPDVQRMLDGIGAAADDEDESPEEWDPFAGVEDQAKNLPFKVSSPAADILATVVGKEIVWISSLTGAVCSAHTLPSPDQKQLRIEYNAAKKRILTFAARGEGFRSVYIESIIAVR